MTTLFFLIGLISYYSAVSLRHYWFQTSSWDLGIFDQAVFLISKGLEPKSSLLGFHILGDHAALVLYPIGWLSSIFPTINLLFILQSSALASLVFPLSDLAKSLGLSKRNKLILLIVGLLYPIVFNTAIFDFHPETLAFPLILKLIVELENNNQRINLNSIILILLALTCKITISIFIFGLGIWLLIVRKKLSGLILTSLSAAWFIVMGKYVIPLYGGDKAELGRHLGKFGIDQTSGIDVIPSIMSRLITQLLSLNNIEYIILLLLPVIYILLHKRRLEIISRTAPFLPLLILNLLAKENSMKNLVHHYSLLLVPILLVEVGKTLKNSKSGLSGYPNWMIGRINYIILGWSVICFITFSRIGFYFGTFQDTLDTAIYRREAIEYINKDIEVKVLTNNSLVPHLSRRKEIQYTNSTQLDYLDNYDQILLDSKHPGWGASKELIEKMKSNIKSNKKWMEVYNKGDVTLYNKK